MKPIKVAVIGVGNCASSLVQGVAYYRNNNSSQGLIHDRIGGYGAGDVDFVLGVDVDARKVGKDIAEAIFAKSIFTSKERMAKFLGKPSASKLEADVLYKITNGYWNKLRVDLKPVYDGINSKLDRANRLFLSAQLEMSASNNVTMAPDANGTMRLTYGTVMAYDARDAVSYSYFTTAKGILEKYKAADFEFDAPQQLLALIRARDFGQYADKDGELHTCFLSDNDITGGNSGSPVMNAKGELIGTAFDGNWEAISSDFAFLPKVQRTISLDVRYTLFIVEKLGGAKHLIDEMTIVK